MISLKHSAVLTCLLMTQNAFSAANDFVIGGINQDGTCYAALITPPNGTITALSDISPDPGFGILSVSINISGSGIIAGEAGGKFGCYIATFGTDGVLHTCNNIPTLAQMFSACINDKGLSLVGGYSYDTGKSYVALITNNTATPVIGTDILNTEALSVALNSSGNGIVSFNNGTVMLIPPSGPAVLVSGDLTAMPVNSVAINNLGVGLIGGGTVSAPGYAALVSPNGIASTLSGTLPINGPISSVAINDAGEGLIGGSNFPPTGYAAQVSAQGSITELDVSGSSHIYSASINSSGSGILGGDSASNEGYIALVTPGRPIQPITISSISQINSVAISQSGISIVGGEAGITGTGYCALIAPNGSLTPLTELPGITSNINSVATPSPFQANFATPSSVGPYTGAATTLLSAAYAMNSHLATQIHSWTKRFSITTADAGEIVYTANCQTKSPISPTPTSERYTVWAAPFGSYIHQKQNHQIPSLDNSIAGILAAFDYRGENTLAGAGFGYGYNSLHYGQLQGHSRIQEELAVLYGAYKKERFWLDIALWAGLYQTHGSRFSVFNLVTSKMYTHGWLCSPHLELAFPQESASGWFTTEPFFMFDWVNNWQASFTETGASGLNVAMPHLYNSLLRSELGLRWYQSLQYQWGRLLIEEKTSYINQAPFHFHNATTYFVGATSTFPIAIGSTQTQNLCGIELRASLFPTKATLPYATFDFQGQFGNLSQTYFGNLEIGKKF